MTNRLTNTDKYGWLLKCDQCGKVWLGNVTVKENAFGFKEARVLIGEDVKCDCGTLGKTLRRDQHDN